MSNSQILTFIKPLLALTVASVVSLGFIYSGDIGERSTMMANELRESESSLSKASLAFSPVLLAEDDVAGGQPGVNFLMNFSDELDPTKQENKTYAVRDWVQGLAEGLLVPFFLLSILSLVLTHGPGNLSADAHIGKAVIHLFAVVLALKYYPAWDYAIWNGITRPIVTAWNPNTLRLGEESPIADLNDVTKGRIPVTVHEQSLIGSAAADCSSRIQKSESDNSAIHCFNTPISDAGMIAAASQTMVPVTGDRILLLRRANMMRERGNALTRYAMFATPELRDLRGKDLRDEMRRHHQSRNEAVPDYPAMPVSPPERLLAEAKAEVDQALRSGSWQERLTPEQREEMTNREEAARTEANGSAWSKFASFIDNPEEMFANWIQKTVIGAVMIIQKIAIVAVLWFIWLGVIVARLFSMILAPLAIVWSLLPGASYGGAGLKKWFSAHTTILLKPVAVTLGLMIFNMVQLSLQAMPYTGGASLAMKVGLSVVLIITLFKTQKMFDAAGFDIASIAGTIGSSVQATATSAAIGTATLAGGASVLVGAKAAGGAIGMAKNTNLGQAVVNAYENVKDKVQTVRGVHYDKDGKLEVKATIEGSALSGLIGAFNVTTQGLRGGFSSLARESGLGNLAGNGNFAKGMSETMENTQRRQLGSDRAPHDVTKTENAKEVLLKAAEINADFSSIPTGQSAVEQLGIGVATGEVQNVVNNLPVPMQKSASALAGHLDTVGNLIEIKSKEERGGTTTFVNPAQHHALDELWRSDYAFKSLMRNASDRPLPKLQGTDRIDWNEAMKIPAIGGAFLMSTKIGIDRAEAQENRATLARRMPDIAPEGSALQHALLSLPASMVSSDRSNEQLEVSGIAALRLAFARLTGARPGVEDRNVVVDTTLDVEMRQNGWIDGALFSDEQEEAIEGAARTLEAALEDLASSHSVAETLTSGDVNTYGITDARARAIFRDTLGEIQVPTFGDESPAQIVFDQLSSDGRVLGADGQYYSRQEVTLNYPAQPEGVSDEEYLKFIAYRWSIEQEKVREPALDDRVRTLQMESEVNALLAERVLRKQ